MEHRVRRTITSRRRSPCGRGPSFSTRDVLVWPTGLPSGVRSLRFYAYATPYWSAILIRPNIEPLAGLVEKVVKQKMEKKKGWA